MAYCPVDKTVKTLITMYLIVIIHGVGWLFYAHSVAYKRVLVVHVLPILLFLKSVRFEELLNKDLFSY